jgi:hypothetical protein
MYASVTARKKSFAMPGFLVIPKLSFLTYVAVTAAERYFTPPKIISIY